MMTAFDAGNLPIAEFKLTVEPEDTERLLLINEVNGEFILLDPPTKAIYSYDPSRIESAKWMILTGEEAR